MHKGTPEKGGDPDGYQGISRRGPYERLLLTEWAIADVHPEEFLRRAAAREHSFLQIDRRQEASGRRSIVVLDVSPSQIGSPRLAHLALLILLSQRASNADASFVWTFLQDTSLSFWKGFGANQGKIFERGRQLYRRRTSTSDAYAWWWEHNKLDISPHDEVWWIGSRALCALVRKDRRRAQEHRTVCITEPLEPSTRALDLSIAQKSTTRALRLDLPEREKCRALLTAPFVAKHARSSSKTPDHSIHKSSNLLFSPDGRRLLARLQSGGVIAWSLPNSPHARPGRPRVILPEENRHIVAAGWLRRRFLGLFADRDLNLFVRGLHPGKDGQPSYDKFPGAAMGDGTDFYNWSPRILPCSAGIGARSTPTLFAEDYSGTVLRLDPWNPNTSEIIARGAELWSASGEGHRSATTLLGNTGEPTPWTFIAPTGPLHQERYKDFLSTRIYAAHAYWCLGVGQQLPDTLARQDDVTTWSLLEPRGTTGEKPPVRINVGDAQVLGALYLEGKGRLVALENDRKTFRFHHKEGTSPLTISEHKVLTAITHMHHPLLAWLDEKNNAFVYSMDHHATLFDTRHIKRKTS